MTHTEAIEEMKVLAGRRAWSLQYQTTSYHNGPAIHGYIEHKGSADDAQTYAGAIENVKRMLGLVGCDPAPEDTE